MFKMQSFNIKYQKKTGIVFLTIYVSLLFVGTIHYHKFTFSVKSTYSKAQTSDTYNDLSPDFLNVCKLHQFSQTIDDFHYSSVDIVQSLSLLESNLSHVWITKYSQEEYSKKSPRAPPVFFSWINNNYKFFKLNLMTGLERFCWAFML